jgi:hypothetical protein
MADSSLFGGGQSPFETSREAVDVSAQQREGQNGDPRQDTIDRRKLAKEVEEYVTYYSTQLETPFQNMVRYHKLFLNEVKDRRKRDEGWRAFVPRPYAWSTIKAMSAAYNDMILGQTPTIKPHAISSKNSVSGQNIQSLLDFIFRRTRFPSELKRATEEHGIQGVSVRKNVLVEKSIQTFVHPSEEKERAFNQAMAEAMASGTEVPNPAEDRQAFEAWRLQANELMGLGIPEPPFPGPRKMRSYFGPSFQHTSIFDLYLDPSIFYPEDQPIVIQRSIRPIQWLKDLTGPEDDKIFDPEAVAMGLRGIPDSQVSKWQRDIMSMYGLSSDNVTNPHLKDAVEIWEAWYPSAKQFQYRIILNRQVVINKNMDNPYPFKHPYIFMRNNTISGNALGISEFKVVERLFYEMNTLASLRLDALTMNVIPMFVKSRDGKLSQKESFVRPGKVFSSSNPTAMRQLIQAGIDPSLFKEEFEVKNEINEATGTLPVVRGQMAAPRVPTGNVQQASQASFLRIKDRILEFEGEINPFLTNSLAMCYQFWPDELLVRVGGDPRLNPFVTYKQDDFLEAIEADYAFQGARTAFDQDALIAASKEWFTILAGVIDALPDYKISEHARVISQMILKDGADQIFMSEEELMEQQKAAEEEAAAAETAEGGGETPVEEAPVDGPPQEEA